VGWARPLAWLVAVGGLVDLVSAAVPRPDAALGALERAGPGVLYPAVHALVVPVGALLLILSRGLAQQRARAWQLSVALLGMSAVLHLLRGPRYGAAILTALIAVVLLARRQDFPLGGDPEARPPALLRLAVMLALACVFGVAAVLSYRLIGGLSFGLASAVSDTARALVGMQPIHQRDIGADFARWFPVSVASIVAVGLAWAAAVWLRPWRERIFPAEGRRERAAAIVRSWGGDTLAPFTLRADKDWFVTGRTLIAFRVVRGVAVVSGDPVGPPEEAGQALDEFIVHAHSRGWHIAVLGASDRLLQAYHDRGLHPTYHGDEAVVDVAAFSLEGRRMRTVRQAVHRTERHGYRAEAETAAEVPRSLRAELEAIDRAWLAGGVRKGFTMELDSLFRLGGRDAVFLIGKDEAGRLAGCLHMAVCPPSKSLSLSSMPRRRNTPNGFSAWLIVSAVSWARANGFEHVSLNFAPFGALLSGRGSLSAIQRLERRALLILKRALALQLDNLVRFDEQFCPRWQPRYVVVERRSDLPRVALAAMAAEGYLPHADLIRGADWQPREPSQTSPPTTTPADPAATGRAGPGLP
jgi:lysyl-tRNA synthetase, class II